MIEQGPLTNAWNGSGKPRSEFAPPVDLDAARKEDLDRLEAAAKSDKVAYHHHNSIRDRMDCLSLAVESARNTGAYDAVKTAERYYRFATGQPVEDETAGLTFTQRLDALTREFLRDERSDQRKMLHELEEYVISYRKAFGPVDEVDERGHENSEIDERMSERIARMACPYPSNEDQS